MAQASGAIEVKLTSSPADEYILNLPMLRGIFEASKMTLKADKHLLVISVMSVKDRKTAT